VSSLNTTSTRKWGTDPQALMQKAFDFLVVMIGSFHDTSKVTHDCHVCQAIIRITALLPPSCFGFPAFKKDWMPIISTSPQRKKMADNGWTGRESLSPGVHE
jgi:hypothetical protein